MVIAIKSHIDFQNIKILFFFFLTFFLRILVRARTRVFELVDFVLEMCFFLFFANGNYLRAIAMVSLYILI